MKKLLITIAIIFINYSYSVQNIVVYSNNKSNDKIKIAVSGVNDATILQEMAFDLNLSGELLLENIDSLDKAIKSNSKYQIKVHIYNNNTNKVLQYTVQETATNKILISYKTIFNDRSQRKVIHMMDNAIYQAITKSPASFTSKIATIIKNDNQYQLIVSDYDGYNTTSILRTTTPISSLAWSRDNSHIAYVFYEQFYGGNKPLIYTQNLSTGKRTLIAAFDGSNSSPLFINNDKLIVTLSKDGGSHLYMIDNSPYDANKKAIPLLKFGGEIDTEADVSNEGKLIFTSDHDGNPQIFTTTLSGNSASKLTNLIGNHLTTARFSKDGKKITFINKNKDTGFKTFYYNLNNQVISCISDTNADIAPSFSPDNNLVLYSSHDTLYISSTIKNKISAISLQNNSYNEVIDQRWCY